MAQLPNTNLQDYQKLTFKYNSNEFVFYNALCSISQSKKISTSEIPGRDGTIKEFIGQDDYQITIDGSIDGKNGSYPDLEVLQLKKFLDLADLQNPIQVINTWLNDLGVFNLVIKEYTLEQMAGGYSYQPYSITALSELPIELQMQ
jgi:hypothetical protein